MPGIVGIIRRQSYEGIEQDLRLMIESIRHESYYVGDQYINREIGLYAGWLSHPGTLGERMPLMSHDKRRVLIIVGEHFGSSSHGVEPQNSGCRTDTGDLLRLYEESETRFLNSLNGWFSGLAIDLALGKVTLFNDRYGMSRMYVHESADEFIFASEAKALLRIRPELRGIEAESLAEYLRFNCVMGNRTLFKGVSLLPGASSWAFEGCAAPQKGSYFDFGVWRTGHRKPRGLS